MKKLSLAFMLIAACGSPQQPICSTIANGTSCQCTFGYGSETTDCNATSFTAKNVMCCSDPDWPTVGSHCACSVYTCLASLGADELCTCSFNTDATDTPLTSCGAPAGGRCCFDPPSGQCSCFTSLSSCGAGEQETADCATYVIPTCVATMYPMAQTACNPSSP